MDDASDEFSDRFVIRQLLLMILTHQLELMNFLRRVGGTDYSDSEPPVTDSMQRGGPSVTPSPFPKSTSAPRADSMPASAACARELRAPWRNNNEALEQQRGGVPPKVRPSGHGNTPVLRPPPAPVMPKFSADPPPGRGVAPALAGPKITDSSTSHADHSQQRGIKRALTLIDIDSQVEPETGEPCTEAANPDADLAKKNPKDESPQQDNDKEKKYHWRNQSEKDAEGALVKRSSHPDDDKDGGEDSQADRWMAWDDKRPLEVDS